MLLQGILFLLSSSLLPLVSAEQVSLGDLDVTKSHFPWIRKFASIGDSYSAGLGSGNRLDWKCSRYDQSYAHLLHTSYLGGQDERTHQFLACSGATTTEILENQVPLLEQGLDLLSVSGGGNDIGLTPILNNCIYQFFFATDEDCVSAIEDARSNIANKTGLFRNMTLLLEAAQPKMNKHHGVIYVTGYAGFFGTDDKTCDNITWSVWKDIQTQNATQTLTLELRRSLNELVRAVNQVLLEVTKAIGPNVRFIDYDAVVQRSRGRYCESGIQEPDPSRKGLDFYEWNTVDFGEDRSKVNETGDDVARGTFEGGIAERINKTLQEHPDWEFDPEQGFVNKSKVREEGLIGDTIHWLLPDGWKRVFHLRPEGHAVIARMLLEDLRVNGPGTPWAEGELLEL